MSTADRISEAELEVMRVVWGRGEPLTLAEIRDALADSGWAADTVHTLVRRLHQKGALLRSKDSVYRYAPAIGQEEYTQAKTAQFIRKVYGGNVKGLLNALLDYDGVADGELESLRDYWRREHGKDE